MAKHLDHSILLDKHGWTRAMRNCICGSGLPGNHNYDARGIYLRMTCDKCHEEKMQGYRSDVLNDPNYWHDESIDEDC